MNRPIVVFSKESYSFTEKHLLPVSSWTNLRQLQLIGLPGRFCNPQIVTTIYLQPFVGERSGSVVECRTPEREVGGSRPTAAVLCPWARHFTPRKYWLITQEAVAPSRHDWKIVDWDVKPQHKQTKQPFVMTLCLHPSVTTPVCNPLSQKQYWYILWKWGWLFYLHLQQVRHTRQSTCNSQFGL